MQRRTALDPRSTLRKASVRRLARGGALLGIVVVVLGGLAGPATAQDEPPVPPPDGLVDVVQANGYLDPILVSFIERSLADAERDGDKAFVLQLDSPGAVVSDARLQRTIDRIRSSPVPTAVWVGPSGADAGGDAALLVAAADYRALAPGSSLRAGNKTLGADEAFQAGLTNVPASCERERGSKEGCAATVGDLVVSLPEVPTRQIEQDGQTRLEPAARVRFNQLPLTDRLLHSIASPPVAYLLFVLGMALLVFELFTAGVGVAGVVGAGSFLFGCYGLAVLPTRPLGVGLLVFAMFGYAVDVQTGVPRVWTGFATLSFVAGSLLVYDGVSLSWVTLLAGIIGITVAMIGGMPAMVRTRFSTPTIGREWMIGEEGSASSAIDPDGTVVVRGAPWRARTNRATPIGSGEPIRVAGIEGLVLQVEPLTGAARDYRERRTGEPGVDGT
jgi:membrane-bound serine protease (ClpP class)